MSSFWLNFLNNHEELRATNPVMYSILRQLWMVEMDERSITLGAENLGMVAYAQKKVSEIENAILLYEGVRLTVNVVLDEKKKKVQAPSPLLQYEPTIEDVVLRAGLSPKYSFDNFAVSGSNQVAYAACQAVAENPSHAYNPLFLWGGVGVGKTHLAQSVARTILQRDATKRVFFSPGDQFTNELIESIREKTTPRFRKKYRNLALLIIDDVQFIAGKNTVQEEFFHTFNSVVSGGGQIILTSDRPPLEIKNLEDRLRSRFSGGLIVDLQSPDYELRSAILLIKAKEKNIELDVMTARAIAEQVDDSRALEGTLLSIYARSLSSNGVVDLAAVEAFFSASKPKEALKRRNPADAIRVVCSYYDVKPSHLKSEHRSDHIALPRQVTMYILRNEFGLKHQEIAFILKRKDHTTIIHGVDKISKLMLQNPSFKTEVDKIIQTLRQST